jgi:flagellum-specific peptidoglycan hydrolase FlgJ
MRKIKLNIKTAKKLKKLLYERVKMPFDKDIKDMIPKLGAEAEELKQRAGQLKDPFELDWLEDIEADISKSSVKDQKEDKAMMVDDKRIIKLPNDSKYLYAVGIDGKYYTIKYKNFNASGGNKWISLDKYPKSIAKVKAQGVRYDPREKDNNTGKDKIEKLITGQKRGKQNLHPYQKAFFKKYIPLILASSKGSKIFPSVSIAQAALETGWGRKTPGGNSNNLFGIKATGSPNKFWDGASVNSKTKEEYKPGEISNIRSNFRKYKTEKDSVLDHNRLLNTSKHYKSVRAANNLDAQIDALHASPYATDNEYGPKLRKIIEDYNLKKYDELGKDSNLIGENKKIIIDFIKLLNEGVSAEGLLGEYNIAFLKRPGPQEKIIDSINQRFKHIDDIEEFTDTKAGLRESGDDFAMRIYNLLIDILDTGKWYEKGSKKPEVFYIQLALATFKKGFANQLEEADGDYGGKTKETVIYFQKLGNIKADGEFGKQCALAMLVAYFNGGKPTALYKIDKEKILLSLSGKTEKITPKKDSKASITDTSKDKSDQSSESKVTIEGDEFIVNGMRFVSVPTEGAATKALNLYNLAKGYADAAGENLNEEKWESTTSGLKFLSNHLYGKSPEETIKLKGGGYQDSDGQLTNGEHVLNGTWQGVPVGKENDTPTNRKAFEKQAKKAGYPNKDWSIAQLINGIYVNPQSGAARASANATAWSSPFWKRCYEEYVGNEGISNSQLEYSYKRALELRRKLEKNPDSYLNKTMFLLFKAGGQGNSVVGSHNKDTWERVPILKGDSQVQYNNGGSFDKGVPNERGHMNVYLDDGSKVIGGNLGHTIKIIDNVETSKNQSFKGVFGIYKRVKFLGMEVEEQENNKNNISESRTKIKLVKEFLKMFHES